MVLWDSQALGTPMMLAFLSDFEDSDFKKPLGPPAEQEYPKYSAQGPALREPPTVAGACS